MELKATWYKHTLDFLTPAGTSRGIMETREVWYIFLIDNLSQGKMGIGECAPLKKLSIDDRPDFESYLNKICSQIGEIQSIEQLYALVDPNFPSVLFGLEMAFLDLKLGGKRQYFSNSFAKHGGQIPINGLIWMGSKEAMKNQIEEKLKSGFSVLKLKIGAIDFNAECELLEFIRDMYSPQDLEIRVDANGAFTYQEALDKLNTLSEFHLHSIEQPIKAGQLEFMKRICEKSLVPVALDEELIGIINREDKIQLLKKINPPYIILKPSLLGGIKATAEWIEIAESLSIGWWVTSALESNIGLNAIAQFAAGYGYNTLPQGLGTGKLFSSNIEAPISIEQGNLIYSPEKPWKYPDFMVFS